MRLACYIHVHVCQSRAINRTLSPITDSMDNLNLSDSDSASLICRCSIDRRSSKAAWRPSRFTVASSVSAIAVKASPTLSQDPTKSNSVKTSSTSSSRFWETMTGHIPQTLP
eukprot:Blabericola_migrator_1__4466@NODE_238_length_10988_cov_97_569087_g202_i0_p11_GENE_NODE_238_length_10988_cov_97_569087_g202_i0NODE_238_length_10988_cov_97_569087_g202_i0_p11_ORF_typecomplete_len112_score7_84_NODE_238_length_10988_cov_97_569087_g202_i011431478